MPKTRKLYILGIFCFLSFFVFINHASAQCDRNGDAFAEMYSWTVSLCTAGVSYTDSCHTGNLIFNFSITSSLVRLPHTRMQIAADAGFAGIVYDSGWISNSGTTITIPASVLSPSTTYYWRMSYLYDPSSSHPICTGWTTPGEAFATRAACAGPPPPPPVPPAIDITANGSNGPLTVAYGSAVLLNWDSTGADSCSASGGSSGWLGAKSVDGAFTTGGLTSSSNFTITCANSAGSNSDSVAVNVLPAPPAPPPPIPPVFPPGTPFVDLDVGGSDGPIMVVYGSSVVLSWSSSNADSCAASGAWLGGKPVNGSQIINNLTSNSIFSLTCTNSSSGNVYVDNVVVNIDNSSLAVLLDANPNTGGDPLNSNLTAYVMGSAVGTVNYSFWWNCNSAVTGVSNAETACGALPAPVVGTCQTNSNGAKCNGMSATTQTVSRSYSLGNYTPKVIVERGSASPAESRDTVTVLNACLPSCGAWGACPVPCGGGHQIRVCVAPDCGTYTETNPVLCNNFPCMDFSLTKSGDLSVQIIRGLDDVDTTPVRITVLPIAGFNQRVDLSIQNPGIIPGATYHFSRDFMNPSQFVEGVDFWITIPNSIVEGTYVVTIQGVGFQPQWGFDITRTLNINVAIEVKDPSYIEF